MTVTDERAAELLDGAPPATVHEHAYMVRAHALTVAHFRERKKQAEAMVAEIEADIRAAQAAEAAATKALVDAAGGLDYSSPFYGFLETRPTARTTYPDRAAFEAWCRDQRLVQLAYPGIGDLQKHGWKWSRSGALYRPDPDRPEHREFARGIHRETGEVVVFVPTAPDELTAILDRAT